MFSSSIRRLILIFCATLLLTSTLLFFVPLHIYYTNTIEFAASGKVILIALGIITIVLAGIISLLTVLLSKRHDQIIISFFVGISFAIWLQAYILPGQYGVLDGQPIDWHDHIYEGMLDSFAWITILILSIKFHKTIFKRATHLIIALFLIQGINLSIGNYYAPPEALYKDFTIDESTKFTFSKKENIIIIVLDAFQSNYFTEIIKKHPEYLAAFKGFTYFPDTLGGFPTTYPSIPLILTGKYYDNSQPIRTFIQKAFNQTDSLLKRIRDQGYKIEMYPNLPQTVDFSSGIISNARTDAFNMAKITEVIQSLWQISTFRDSPTIIKQLLNQSTITDDLVKSTIKMPEDVNDSRKNLTFVKDLKAHIDVVDSAPIFKFYHLPGTHTPLLIDENLEYHPLQTTSEGYSRAAEGVIKLTADLLDTLAKHGTYDNSTIILVGDHGSGMPVSLAPGSVSNYIWGRGLPLLLIKPAKAKSEFTTSMTPVTLSTIATMIEPALKNGMSTLLDQLKNPSPTPRHFFFYDWTDGNGFSNSQEYLPTMREYIINGPVFDSNSWQRTNHILTPQHTQTTVDIPTYKLGQKLTFDYTDTAQEYKAEGWSVAEHDATWTDGEQATQASLNFQNLPTSKNLILKVEGTPFIHYPEISEQIVEVFCNDNHVATWHAYNEDTYQTIIPHEYLKTNSKITFKIPNSKSPAELDANPDIRKLGIAVKSVVITEQSTITYDKPVNFGSNNMFDESLLTFGWGTPEITGTWSLGTKANVVLNLPEGKPEPVELAAQITPFLHTPELSVQKVTVQVNGKNLGQWNIDKAGVYKIRVPEELTSQGQLNITFLIPNASSVATFYQNEDTRILGINLESLTLNTRRIDGIKN